MATPKEIEQDLKIAEGHLAVLRKRTNDPSRITKGEQLVADLKGDLSRATEAAEADEAEAQINLMVANREIDRMAEARSAKTVAPVAQVPPINVIAVPASDRKPLESGTTTQTLTAPIKVIAVPAADRKPPKPTPTAPSKVSTRIYPIPELSKEDAAKVDERRRVFDSVRDVIIKTVPNSRGGFRRKLTKEGRFIFLDFKVIQTAMETKAPGLKDELVTGQTALGTARWGVRRQNQDDMDVWQVLRKAACLEEHKTAVIGEVLNKMIVSNQEILLSLATEIGQINDKNICTLSPLARAKLHLIEGDCAIDNPEGIIAAVNTVIIKLYQSKDGQTPTPVTLKRSEKKPRERKEKKEEKPATRGLPSV